MLDVRLWIVDSQSSLIYLPPASGNFAQLWSAQTNQTCEMHLFVSSSPCSPALYEARAWKMLQENGLFMKNNSIRDAWNAWEGGKKVLDLRIWVNNMTAVCVFRQQMASAVSAGNHHDACLPACPGGQCSWWGRELPWFCSLLKATQRFLILTTQRRFTFMFKNTCGFELLGIHLSVPISLCVIFQSPANTPTHLHSHTHALSVKVSST